MRSGQGINIGQLWFEESDTSGCTCRHFGADASVGWEARLDAEDGSHMWPLSRYSVALPICGLLNWSLSSVQKDQLASGMRCVRIPVADRTARLLTLFRRVYCMPRQFPVPLASQILPAPANYTTVLLTTLIRVHEYVCVHTSKPALMSWQNSHAGVGLWYIPIFFLFVLFEPHCCAY